MGTMSRFGLKQEMVMRNRDWEGEVGGIVGKGEWRLGGSGNKVKPN